MIESRERFVPAGTGAAEQCERVERFLRRQGLCEREAARMRMTVETLLRRIAERFGRTARCELELGQRLGRAYIRISYPGAEFDPTLTGREEEGNAWSERLLTELGLVPQWSRKRGVNSLTLCPRGRNYGAWIAYAAALALAVPLTLALGGGTAATVGGALLEQAFETVRAIWGVLTAPLLFAVLISVICGAADTAQLGRQGRDMLARLTLPTLLWSLLGTAASALLFRLPIASAFTAAEKVDAGAAAAQPDAVRVTLAALAVGIVLALLGGRTARLREGTEQLAVLLRTLAEFACRLAPLAVVAVLPGLYRSGRILPLWKLLAVFALLSVTAAAVKLLLVCVGRHDSPIALLQKLSAAAGESVKCASTDSTIGLTMDNCENELELSHTLTLLALPTGNVLCAPIIAIALSASVCFAAGRAGVEASVPWLAGLALLSALLAIVLPHVPGALTLGLALLVRQLMLPGESLALLVPLCLILEAASAALGSVYLRLALLGMEETDMP